MSFRNVYLYIPCIFLNLNGKKKNRKKDTVPITVSMIAYFAKVMLSFFINQYNLLINAA